MRPSSQEHGPYWRLIDVYGDDRDGVLTFTKCPEPHGYPTIFDHAPRKYLPEIAIAPSLQQFKDNMEFVSGKHFPAPPFLWSVRRSLHVSMRSIAYLAHHYLQVGFWNSWTGTTSSSQAARYVQH